MLKTTNSSDRLKLPITARSQKSTKIRITHSQPVSTKKLVYTNTEIVVLILTLCLLPDVS